MNKTLLKIAGILVVVAAVVVGFYMMYKDSIKNADQTKQQAFAVSKNELIATQIPSGFPEDLPVEADAKVLQNYEATTTDGRVQSTRVMTTEETLSDAIQVYTDFFAKLGWVEVPGGNTPDSTVLMLKDNNTLLISANGDASNEKSISLTLTAAK